jgi:NADPH-dependent glutamate synthase beta subunit-like oxidoreductase/Pyruvate/2-oxoacid:ferredoxin oxidoreductase delta subunit
MSNLNHVDDYPEIPVSLASTSTVLKTGAWRSVRPVLTERSAPCSGACPAGVGVPAYLHDIKEGRLKEAFTAVTSRNPFPRITGRVCPHFCEHVCNLAERTDRPSVSIRGIERWLGDETASLPHPTAAEETGHRVAVVGSGPAGMAAAYYLRRSGHAVSVFDRRDRPGGILRYGIPDYRLPTAIVEEELLRLEAMGIEFHNNITLGVDVTFPDLETLYAAVFLATGAGNERAVDIDGESLLEPGLAFLEAVSRNEATLPGGRCAVVGGGNTAMDVARVLRRMEAAVTVLYRRTVEEVPAIREEYEHAVADGVTFQWLTLPRSVKKFKTELAITVEEMRLGEPDESGRRRPQPTGVTRELRFDGVFAATGETADTIAFPDRMKDSDGWLIVGENGSTTDPLVYAGGDLATGPATVIEAIVAGRRAARAIDHQLGFDHLWPEDDPAAVVGPAEVNPTYLPHHVRVDDHHAQTTEPFAEESLTISEAEVLQEIERCLSCGHCNSCGTCFVFCPDGVITWDEGPVIDLEFCKGCGICVAECPGHAVILVNEREPSHA